MKRVLYCGPTLPDAGHLRSAGISVLPPVAAGDLLRLDVGDGDLVGIIDGYFHQARSVRHKEILTLIERGVRVIGAASFGALRAAELDTFGMLGVGGIYRDYRDGLLVADDEVALSHGPREAAYRQMSEPLVNIRATLDHAVRKGVLPARMRTLVIDRLSAMPYPARHYRAVTEILREADLCEESVREAEQLCRAEPVDRKRADAVELVDHLCRPSAGPRNEPLTTNRTIFLQAWEVAAQGTDEGDGAGRVADLALLRCCQVFADDYPDRHRRRVIATLAEECRQTCSVHATGDHEARAIAHGVHRGFYGPPDEPGDFSFLATWLTAGEQRDLKLPEQLVTFLVRSFRVAPGILDDRGAIRAAERDGLLARARQLTRAAVEVNTRVRQSRRDFALDAIPADRLLDWVAGNWDVPVEELPLHLLDRGLDTPATLVAMVRPYYLFAKYNPGQATFARHGDAAAFDHGFTAIAASTRHKDLFRGVLGLPPEVEPNSFVTGDGLEEIAAMLAIGPGDRLVDLGCGRGGPGLWLARRTGAGVCGVDFSRVALEQATQRAELFGLEDRADFRYGDLTASGLPDGHAAAVVCVDAFHLAADPDAAAVEALRVLRPGGRYVLTGWQPAEPGDPLVPESLRLDIALVLRRAGFVALAVSDRPDETARQERLFEAVRAEDPVDEAMAHLKAEAATVRDWSTRMRRVLIVAEKPAD